MGCECVLDTLPGDECRPADMAPGVTGAELMPLIESSLLQCRYMCRSLRLCGDMDASAAAVDAAAAASIVRGLLRLALVETGAEGRLGMTGAPSDDVRGRAADWLGTARAVRHESV